jgi:hypothetical protein
MRPRPQGAECQCGELIDRIATGATVRKLVSFNSPSSRRKSSGSHPLPVIASRAVHLITQSVCMTLVYRATYSSSEIPSKQAVLDGDGRSFDNLAAQRAR